MITACSDSNIVESILPDDSRLAKSVLPGSIRSISILKSHPKRKE